ncbi:transposase mutator type [Methylocaldum marinum]|uniref:Mutator family transposase n=1 Tax=Methylocaldum marinum TaxID=1432792 RepID=A0A250L2U0_9GAMM|nr:IS256 family transposase [Methylocaldum marinum]BBA36909.1 transposase mutator type [Methylocaldum marinum]BBA37571.1 transposase mutator type [Methylocaldum marinum]
MTSDTAKQDALLDELLKGYTNPKDILGEHGLLKQLTRRLVERALEAEMTAHLGYAPHAPEGRGSGNSRNGKSAKTIQTETGPLAIEVPRDRNGDFEPQLVSKRQRRLEGFDEKVLALYARGLSTRGIQGHLEELYGVEVSPTLISNVTESVLADVKAWQSRPLASVYPILYFDALIVKSREAGPVKNKAVYLALGVNLQGEKERLGLWIADTEGAKFWLSVFTELKNRGVQDGFIACVDGLKGLPEAIETVFPNIQVQRCIVHKVRHSLQYVTWKERKAVAKDLRAIYGAATLTEAEAALARFADTWDAKYPAISQSWRADWTRLTVFFDYPPEIRKVLYTTNAIESLNFSLRKLLKTRGAFPNDEAILKVLYLGLQRIEKKWTMPIQDWKRALNHFVILFGNRVTL